jgi:hypothetical protein
MLLGLQPALLRRLLRVLLVLLLRLQEALEHPKIRPHSQTLPALLLLLPLLLQQQLACYSPLPYPPHCYCYCCIRLLQTFAAGWVSCCCSIQLACYPLLLLLLLASCSYRPRVYH